MLAAILLSEDDFVSFIRNGDNYVINCALSLVVGRYHLLNP